MIPQCKKIEKEIGKKNSITYYAWHSVILARSDTNFLYLMCYGIDKLKEGQYSIKDNFSITPVGGTYLEIGKEAIYEINRHDWGIEIVIDRTKINNFEGYDGVVIVSGNICIQSK